MRNTRKNRQVRSRLWRWVTLGVGLTPLVGTPAIAALQPTLPAIVKQTPPATPQGQGQPTPLPPTTVEGSRSVGTPSAAPFEQSNLPQPSDRGGPFGVQGAFGSGDPGPFLPDVQGTRIYGGKKTENIDLVDRPTLIDYNYRQALIKVPGLLLSEESTPLVAIGIRGLDPDRNQYIQMLEDGIPLGANIMGFNESYYLPPFQILDRIEVIRGGSALLYGPQPGGAMNFITKMPVTDRPLQVVAENAVGSHNLFSTFESASGTSGDLGYYVYGLHRQSDGFRTFNSQFDLNYGGAKLVYQLSPNSRIIGNINTYKERHGEPGRLTREDFDRTPDLATRPFDYFQLERTFGSVTYQSALDEYNYFELRSWANNFVRFSRRQRGGDFGTVPTSDRADYRLEEFNVFGIEPRYRHDYDLFGGCKPSTFTIGGLLYYNDGERKDSRGTVTGAGKVGDEARTFADRTTKYGSLFAENRFVLGNLSVTPGVRLEWIEQSVTESINVAKTGADKPLGDQADRDFVPLFGCGVAYTLAPKTELYGNISQAYRPKLFQEFLSPGPNEIVLGDIAPGHSYQADIGFRTNPTPFFSLDTSLFYLDLKDQVGTIRNVIQNVGATRNRGWEFAAEVDLVGALDAVQDTSYVSHFGSLSVFANAMLLNARFYEGPNRGKSPQYAPEYIVRGGLTYVFREEPDCCGVQAAGGDAYGYAGKQLVQIWLTSTFVGEHFGDDGHTEDFFIPSYKVWDLTAEVKVWRDTVSVFGGVYNLLDKRYFARVRGDGIEPLDGRNYQLGVRLVF